MKRSVFGALTAAVLCLCTVWLTADGLLGLTDQASETVTVPQLVGADESVAADYDWLEVTTEYRYDDAPAGTILAQTPAAGSQRKRTSRRAVSLRLTVSLGRARVEMPELCGTDARTAAGTLRGLGLAVEEIRLPGGVSGQVAGTEPAGGSAVDVGGTVRLYISAGESARTVAVPNLVGLTRGAAILTLFRAGLAVREEIARNAYASALRVAEQTPAAGSVVLSGTQVVLRFSDADESDTDFVQID